MDPLSIAASCVGLISVIGQSSIAITNFLRGCREARRELLEISRELGDLKVVLELLKDDPIPDALRTRILDIMRNCEYVVKQIELVLEKHAGGTRLDQAARWALTGRSDVTKLQLTLCAHRGALNLALEMVSLSVAPKQRRDACRI
jgi:hypothetical protein